MGAVANTFVVEPLTLRHDREHFDCGVEVLNRYLRTQARQEMDRDVAVAFASPLPDRANVNHRRLLRAVIDSGALGRPARGHAQAPAALSARARDIARTSGRGPDLRGRGLGERLLIDALQRSLAASRSVASVAVIVDAKDEAGATFYARYGFIAFPDQPLRLFLPMKTIAALEG